MSHMQCVTVKQKLDLKFSAAFTFTALSYLIRKLKEKEREGKRKK